LLKKTIKLQKESIISTLFLYIGTSNLKIPAFAGMTARGITEAGMMFLKKTVLF